MFDTAHTWQTLRSFAACTAEPVNCSCAMLSPSIVMTSAHCITRGTPEIINKIWFRNYHNGDFSDFTDEDFDCLVTPFHSHQASQSDIMLLECSPNASGYLPGDKYGFIDTYNLTDISEGTSVASFWSNPVDDDGQDAKTILYAWGTITNNRSTAWPPVSCDSGVNHWAIVANLYSNYGASGSMWISETYGFRTLTAPTSTGEIEDYGRTSAVLGNVLWGDSDDSPWVEEYINQSAPGPTECSVGLRVDKMDENNDGLFDPITEIDSNLAQRSIYALNMDARHRRAMWHTYYPTPMFDWIFQTFPYWVSGVIRPPDGSTGWNYFLRRQLPLYPNQKYHVRVEYKRENTSDNYLYLGVYFYGSGCTYNTFKQKTYYYPTQPVDPKMFTFEVDTAGCTGNPSLYLHYYNDVGIVVHRVTVAIKNSVWTFDNWDTREEWRKDFDEGHALITPDGMTTGTSGLWAMTCSGELSKEWNENCQNRAIPLLPNTNYRIKFYQKELFDMGNPSYVLVRSKTAFANGENNVLYQEFSPSHGYYGLKEYTFHTNNYDDYYVSFGQKWGGIYYVDSVSVWKI